MLYFSVQISDFKVLVLGWLFFAVSVQGLMAQSVWTNIKIAEANGTSLGPSEPSIAIDPLDPSRMVAGAVLDFVSVSADSGYTWKTRRLRSRYGVFGDPCIITDQQGNFYYFHLSDPSGKGWQDERLLDRIVSQRSADGGKTWTKGSYTGMRHPKDQDKEWAVADGVSGNIYLTWTEFDNYGSEQPEDKSRILFSFSDDKAAAWSEPVAINEIPGDCLDDDGTVEGAVPATGPNGEIYVAWSVNEKIYFDRSTDRGKTWLAEDIMAAEQPGGWVFEIPGMGRANGLPVTVCDLSDGPHRGTIYINYADQRNGEGDTDIWLASSEDGGNTWSAPVRVNNDPAGKHQFFSWVTVDPVTGILYIVYYDRRDHEDEQTDVYLAWSEDGGKTFTNQRVSESPFVPAPVVFMGDYNHISAVGGVVRPIWTRLEKNRLSTWTAIINHKP